MARKLNNQSPNSYAKLAEELKPGETLKLSHKDGNSVEIRSEDDLQRAVKPILKARDADRRDFKFEAE